MRNQLVLQLLRKSTGRLFQGKNVKKWHPGYNNDDGLLLHDEKQSDSEPYEIAQPKIEDERIY